MTTSSSWRPQSKVCPWHLDLIELKSPISQKELLEFVEADHNLMIFSDNDAKRPVRELANKFGVEFENVVSYA